MARGDPFEIYPLPTDWRKLNHVMMTDPLNGHNGMEENVQVHRWSRLLSWLESHGMDLSPSTFRVECRPRPGAGYGLFLTNPCPPLGPIFIIPPSALMNVKTLAPLYPGAKRLSAHQLISLHLYLHKPPDRPIDNRFGPFISTLPREFDSHPLTWLVLRNPDEDNKPGSTFLTLLPSATRSLLNTVAERFHQDSSAVARYLNGNGTPGGFDEGNYLWAWLNVNTRCIFYQIRETLVDEANVTLCPILDFANHDWHHSHIQPVCRSDARDTRLKPKCAFQFLATEHIASVGVGEEVCLRYGGHSNQSLFVEYGFVNVIPSEKMESGVYPAEVDVQAIVTSLFETRGVLGSWLRKTIENEGYWGDWTLSTSPNPAAPSFRLITALRLYAMCSEMTDVPAADEEDAIRRPWRDTLLGKCETISPRNEEKWRTILKVICKLVEEEGTAGLQRTMGSRFNQPNHLWPGWMKDNIALLWSEQIVVARAVLRSLEEEIEF